jgi:hypothetical protein
VDLRTATRVRVRAILDHKPANDFLSIYLVEALRTGMPVLTTLQLFQRIIGARQKLRWKAQSITSQARAQAEVLSWLPWMLALAICFVDPAWLLTSSRQPVAWFFWSIALLLTGAGRGWMRRLLLRVLLPSSPNEKLEEGPIPELVLRIMAGISSGLDAQSALERSLQSLKSKELNAIFAGSTHASEKIHNLQGLIAHSCRTGAPLRDDLTSFVNDLYAELESVWEARVQRLPVMLLAPLFLCFFPSTLLVLAGFLIPLLADLQ